MDITNLKSWVLINRSAILIFINEKKKRYWITASKNIVTSMYTIMRTLNSKVNKNILEDANDIEIKMIVDDNSPLEKRDMLVMVNNYVEYYDSLGYKPYREIKLVKYNIKCNIAMYKNHAVWRVHAVSGRKLKVLLGVFYTKEEMDLFTQTYYPDNKVTKLVYSDNELTNHWRSEGIFGIS